MMAVLPDQDRVKVWAYFMRHQAETCGFTKAQLRAAVDATDDWIDTNAAAFNSALPAAFRNNASATQKTIVFLYVALRRAGLMPEEL